MYISRTALDQTNAGTIVYSNRNIADFRLIRLMSGKNSMNSFYLLCSFSISKNGSDTDNITCPCLAGITSAGIYQDSRISS